MRENSGALDKLYSMLYEADDLGLSRLVRLRLINIIGSLESEELDRFRSTLERDGGELDGSTDGDDVLMSGMGH